MVAERHISEDELVAHLSDILRDIEGRQEPVAVTRDGVVVARIHPVKQPSLVTARTVIDRIGDLPFPGDGFGDDLERVQSEQGTIGDSPWRS